MNIAVRNCCFFIFVSFFINLFVLQDAIAADQTLVSQIVSKFYTESSKYEQIMLKYAKFLFYWCAVLEIAWMSIKKALGATDVGDMFKEFCLVLMAAGFFLAVINNYNSWSWSIINGLKSIAGEATNINDAADKPFTIGLSLAEGLLTKTSFFRPIDALTYVLAGFAILLCFALITMQIILIKCECIIAICASSILLGLGATSFFREYAINVLRFIVATGFKLMVMYLIIGIGINFLSNLSLEEDNWMQIGVTLSFCLIFYCLVKTIPDVVAGIIQGSHVSTGNGLTSTVTAMGAGLAGLGMAAGAGMANVGRAAQAARAQGAEGLGGMMAGTASNLFGASREAMHNKDLARNKVASVLRDRIETAMNLRKSSEE